ncbi:archaeosortase A [Halomarina ordinaria]|uniref:Archaeosortase A n=1 Tax=Halomarina ordinaria TaxID=3033939 RepID=A0ABD5U637_9EURY|nr:archaeosortase A [Halomarina sp. PSRA2]
MFGPLLSALEWAHRFADPLAWLVVAAFLGGALLEAADRDARLRPLPLAYVGLLAATTAAVVAFDWSAFLTPALLSLLAVGGATLAWTRGADGARYLSVGAWVLFGVFWLTLVHHFAVTQRSIVEGIGAVVAVPGSLYAGYLLANGRDSLFVLSRAVAAMGLVVLPVESLFVVRAFLIETVTAQTAFLMELLGQTQPADFTVESGTVVGREDLQSTFVFWDGDHRITYTILLACTGVGSMSIFVGAIAAVRAPLSRKFKAFAVSIPVIYALNLVRNVFISLTFGQQRLHVFPDLVLSLFAAEDPYRVSYFVADRILAQSLSVVALVAITYLVVRELPEVFVIIEDALFMLTGKEYELADSFDDDDRRRRPPRGVTNDD